MDDDLLTIEYRNLTYYSTVRWTLCGDVAITMCIYSAFFIDKIKKKWKTINGSVVTGHRYKGVYKVNVSVLRNRTVDMVEVVDLGKFILVYIFRFQGGRYVMV